MADTGKISSLMAESVREILPFMSYGMKPDDVLDSIYSDVVAVLFSEMEEMGVSGPITRYEDDTNGSPVYRSDCLLSPDIIYPFSSVQFVARRNKTGIMISFEITVGDSIMEKSFSDDIELFDGFEKSVAEIGRRCCTELIHTEDSLKKMNEWFSSKTKSERVEKESWRPREGESYVYVDEALDVMVGEYCGANPDDVMRVEQGNCFQDANEALEAIEKARKGEDE